MSLKYVRIVRYCDIFNICDTELIGNKVHEILNTISQIYDALKQYSDDLEPICGPNHLTTLVIIESCVEDISNIETRD